MGRKKRHKLVSALVLGLLAISLAIYEFRGELMIPSVTPSITRRELLTRHMMVPPNDISLAINHLQMLSPSISPLPGEAPHEPPGTMGLAPTVQSAAPPIQPVSPAVQSPAPSITIAPPPLVVPSPNVPTVAVPSSPPNTPIPTSSPVSSPPLVNPPPLVAPSPMILQHVLPPGQNSQPIGHAVSPTGTSTPNTPVAPSPLETPTRLSHSNSSWVRVAAPPISNGVTNHALPPNDSHDNRNATSPVSISPIHHRERAQGPVLAPPKIVSRHFSHRNNSHEANGPLISPATHIGKNATHTLHKPQTSHAVSPTRSALPLLLLHRYHLRIGSTSTMLYIHLHLCLRFHLLQLVQQMEKRKPPPPPPPPLPSHHGVSHTCIIGIVEPLMLPLLPP
ncbi:titin-like protein [Carex littledalei]|uniref:Titin-like protein n=1 Tax=Carex littledalei TaxID=544730 RepID=A0A833QKU8_9POAL|nr:titin-like protein [Carex littledalei]